MYNINNNNLKKVRINANKSQEETAKELNVSRSSYAMWESNNEIIPIKRLLDFSELYHVSLDYIFNLTTINNLQLNHFDKNKYMTRLKEFRKDNKLTQEKLANILNTNKSVICGYEKGRYIIATPFLYTICKKYNISADYLLGKTDHPQYLSK